MGQLTSLLLLLSLSLSLLSEIDAPQSAVFKVPIFLENNTESTQAVTLIWYSPLRFGNSTEQLELEAGERILRKYPGGTKLYVATEQQVGLVMGGGRIDETTPFLKVKGEHRRQTFKLFED